MTAKETLKTFFEEKKLPYCQWELEKQGEYHIIDNEVIIETILNCCNDEEQKKILEMIVKIDFFDGDVNDYLKHLSIALTHPQI